MIARSEVPRIPKGAVPVVEQTGRGLQKLYDVGNERWRRCEGRLVTYIEYSGEAPNHLPIRRSWHAPGW